MEEITLTMEEETTLADIHDIDDHAYTDRDKVEDVNEEHLEFMIEDTPSSPHDRVVSVDGEQIIPKTCVDVPNPQPIPTQVARDDIELIKQYFEVRAAGNIMDKEVSFTFFVSKN